MYTEEYLLGLAMRSMKKMGKSAYLHICYDQSGYEVVIVIKNEKMVQVDVLNILSYEIGAEETVKRLTALMLAMFGWAPALTRSAAQGV